MNLVTKNTHKPTTKNAKITPKPNQANPPRAKESANHKLSLFGGYATMYIENSRKPIRITRAINLNMLSLFSIWLDDINFFKISTTTPCVEAWVLDCVFQRFFECTINDT